MKKSKNLAKKLTALALSATLCNPVQSSKAMFGIFGGNQKGRILKGENRCSTIPVYNGYEKRYSLESRAM